MMFRTMIAGLTIAMGTATVIPAEARPPALRGGVAARGLPGRIAPGHPGAEAGGGANLGIAAGGSTNGSIAIGSAASGGLAGGAAAEPSLAASASGSARFGTHLQEIDRERSRLVREAAAGSGPGARVGLRTAAQASAGASATTRGERLLEDSRRPDREARRAELEKRIGDRKAKHEADLGARVEERDSRHAERDARHAERKEDRIEDRGAGRAQREREEQQAADGDGPSETPVDDAVTGTGEGEVSIGTPGLDLHAAGATGARAKGLPRAMTPRELQRLRQVARERARTAAGASASASAAGEAELPDVGF